MGKGRLEAFSDGVIAIIITIMVLELKPPPGTDLAALRPLLPVFLSYLLSFVYVGIFWNNHHHLFHAVKDVRGAATLWGNLHLLFWLSLIPFVTRWIGESHFARWAVASYGVVLLLCGFAWELLVLALLRRHGPDSTLARAMGHNYKTWLSILIYAGAIAIAVIQPMAAVGLYALVAAIWFIPDSRVEREIAKEER